MIKHTIKKKKKDLVILTKSRKQYNNQIFMEVDMAYREDPYLASKVDIA